MPESDKLATDSLDLGAGGEALKRCRKFWLRAIWISVAAMIMAPMVGLIGTVAGMVGAFGELSKSGNANPEALADDISASLLTTMGGLAVSAIAFLFLIGAIIRFFTLSRVECEASANSQT